MEIDNPKRQIAWRNMFKNISEAAFYAITLPILGVLVNELNDLIVQHDNYHGPQSIIELALPTIAGLAVYLLYGDLRPLFNQKKDPLENSNHHFH